MIGWFLDLFWNLRYWDYSGYFLDFRGYIWQIFFAGPLVRAIFGMIFKEKEPQVMKEEAEYLEGGEAR